MNINIFLQIFSLSETTFQPLIRINNIKMTSTFKIISEQELQTEINIIDYIGDLCDNSLYFDKQKNRGTVSIKFHL
jgi:hypothetical protein